MSYLQFVIQLADPGHQLTHTTVTQAVSGSWMEIWDDYDWVEDLVAEAMRVGIEIIGQEYISARMGWGKKAKDSVASSEGITTEPAASETTAEGA